MKKIIGVFIMTVFSVGIVAAEYNFDGSKNIVDGNIMTTSTPIKSDGAVYPDSKSFLEAEGATCKLATDGCNSISIEDGKLGAMTEMWCEHTYGENGQEKWQCIDTKTSNSATIDDGLTNDERFHQHIKNTLDSAYRQKVTNSIALFKSKTKNYSDSKLNRTIDLLVSALDDMVFSIIMKYPADSALPTEVNNQYLMLELMQFELLDLKK